MGFQTTLAALPQAPRAIAAEMYRAALAETYPDLQRAAVQAILQSAHADAVHELVGAFASLAPPARDAVIENRRSLVPHLRSALLHPDSDVRAGALRVLREIRAPEAGSLAAAALGDADPAVRTLALDVLQHLVSSHLQSPPAPSGAADPSEAPSLAYAVSQALAQYDVHRRVFFLEALLRLGDDGHGVLARLLLGPATPARADLVAVLERLEEESTADFLLRLLRERDEELRREGQVLLRRKRTPAFARSLSRVLGRLRGTAASGPAARVTELPWWPCLGDHLGACDAEDLLQVLAFVMVAKVDPPVKYALMQECLRAPQPPVRRAALRHLRELGPDGARPVLEMGLADPDPGVRLEAIEGVIALNPPDKIKLLTPLLGSPHEAVRQAAMAEISRDSFERYLRSFDRLDERTRSLAGQAIAKIDPLLVSRLAEEIRALEPDRRLKALRIIESINKEQELEPLLRELIRDPDRKVRATVVKTVGLAGSVEAFKVLLRALADPDRRVRANAVEAFEEVENPRVADLLVPFMKDPDNRVRANAVKALWNLGRIEAREVLDEMLRDPDEMMRLSAVWTLGEIDMPGASEILRGVLDRETSVTVRAKIGELLKRQAAPPAPGSP